MLRKEGNFTGNTTASTKEVISHSEFFLLFSIAIHFTSKSIKWFLPFTFYDLNIFYKQIRKYACYVDRPFLLDRAGVCCH